MRTPILRRVCRWTVLQEASVLAQLQVVGVGEGPDPRVGGHDPASQVAAEGALLQMREWLLEQRRPLLVADQPAERLRERSGSASVASMRPATPAVSALKWSSAAAVPA